jgi:hypothetical protein
MPHHMLTPRTSKGVTPHYMSTPLLAEAPEDETQGGDLQSSMYTPQVLPSIQPVAKEEEESSVEGDAQSNKGGVKEENDMPDP